MGCDNTEIEVKLQVDTSEIERLRALLQQTAKMLSKTKDVDLYYIPKDSDWMKVEYPYKWLRLRRSNGGAFITFKHYHPENVRKPTYCKELETKIENIEVMDCILRNLGIVNLVTVTKQRERYEIKNFIVSLDEVDGLGFFVEIEASNCPGGINGARREIEKILCQLEIKQRNFETRGYAYMILNVPQVND